jgi:hypothetical protein
VVLKLGFHVQQTHLRGGFVEHLSPTKVAQQSVTRIISLTLVIVVTSKAGAMHELLFNKTASVSGVTLWQKRAKLASFQNSKDFSQFFKIQ